MDALSESLFADEKPLLFSEAEYRRQEESKSLDLASEQSQLDSDYNAAVDEIFDGETKGEGYRTRRDVIQKLVIRQIRKFLLSNFQNLGESLSAEVC